MKRVVAVLGMLHACAQPAPRPALAPPSHAPAVTAPPFELAMGEYGDYCLLLRGSAFCGDLRFDEPLAKETPAGGFVDVDQVRLTQGLRCLVRRSGAVHCSGENRLGQLGAGRPEQEVRSWPQVLGLGPVRSLSLSPSTVCAIERSGRVLCWGGNALGQTGSHVAHAPEANELVRPSEVVEARGARVVSPVSRSTCALGSDGTLVCWGEPIGLREGVVEAGGRKPTPRPDLGTFEQLTQNMQGHCGLSRGSVRCFGSVDFAAPDDTGRPIEGLPKITQMAMSDSHACAVAEDGSVWCFGRGMYGVLGRDLGQTWEPQEPRRVEGLPPVRSVVTSTFVSCATTRSDEVHCWGGQLQGMNLGLRGPTRVRIE